MFSDVLDVGVVKCKKQFENVYDDCVDVVSPILETVCDAVKLEFLCDISAGKYQSKSLKCTLILKARVEEGHISFVSKTR